MNKLRQIMEDRVSGASTLYKQCLKLFLSDNYLNSPKEITSAVGKIKRSFPEMAIFVYLENQITNVSPDKIIEILNKLLENAELELVAINNRMNRLWRKKRRIVTISQSSVILHILKQNKRKIKSVLLSVSAPQNEGIIMADKMASAGIKVTITSDAVLPGLIAKDDFLFLGADSVTDRYFINKTGSLSLALAAREVKARSFVLCESFKFVKSGEYDFSTKQNDYKEITRIKNNNLKVHNPYFEKIPLRYINWLIAGNTSLHS